MEAPNVLVWPRLIKSLAASQIQGVKARDARSALSGGIRIVQVEIVDEIVAAEIAPLFAVAVDPHAGLVVANNLRLRSGAECGSSGVGKGNVLKKVLRRRRPDPLWNDGVGENAIRSVATAGRIILLAWGDHVAELCEG